MEKVAVKFIKAMHPYRAGEIGLMKSNIIDTREKKGYIEVVREEKQLDNAETKNKSMSKRKKKNKSLQS